MSTSLLGLHSWNVGRHCLICPQLKEKFARRVLAIACCCGPIPILNGQWPPPRTAANATCGQRRKKSARNIPPNCLIRVLNSGMSQLQILDFNSWFFTYSVAQISRGWENGKNALPGPTLRGTNELFAGVWNSAARLLRFLDEKRYRKVLCSMSLP